MRFLLVLAALAATTVSANAQPPKEVLAPVDGTINLQVGETRFFQFDHAVGRVETPSEVIVEITPRSDQTIAFKGLNEGVTMVTVRPAAGGQTHLLQVVVGPRTVKIYGLAEEPDHVAFPCDRFGCGPGASASGKIKPSSQSVTVRSPARGGGFIETTKTW